MPQLSHSCRRFSSVVVIAGLGLGVVLLAALAYSSIVRGQEPPAEWTVSVGTSAFDEVLAVTALPSGAIVAGSTAGSLMVGRQPGSADAFTIKYDPQGDVIWTQQFGTSGTDRAASVAADSTGVYIAGSTTGAFTDETGAGRRDAFLRRSNPGGFLVWTRQFGTVGADQANGVAVDPSGVYVVGSLDGSAAGYSNSEGPDAFIRKYDHDGNLQWEHRLDTGGADQAIGVATHSSGIYVTGTTSGAFPGHQQYGGGSDIFIRKYDPDGTELWTQQFGNLGLDQVSGITVGPEGVYVAGGTTGAFPGQRSYGGGSDAFLLSYDLEGAGRWVRQYGTEGSDEATGVIAHGSRIYITGTTSAAFPGIDNEGENLDGFLIRYSALGGRVWARQFGTAGIDRPRNIAAHGDRLYIAGTIDGSFAVESDGFLNAIATAVSREPDATPTAPAPTAGPEATTIPAPTPTLEATPVPTPLATAVPDPTATPAPAATAEPSATPEATSAPTPQPTPRLGPSPTPWPTFTPFDFAPPQDSGDDPTMRYIVLGMLGVLAIAAIIGVVRNW